MGGQCRHSKNPELRERAAIRRERSELAAFRRSISEKEADKARTALMSRLQEKATRTIPVEQDLARMQAEARRVDKEMRTRMDTFYDLERKGKVTGKYAEYYKALQAGPMDGRTIDQAAPRHWLQRSSSELSVSLAKGGRT